MSTTNYQWVLIRTYRNTSDRSRREPIRASPVAGQGFPPTMHVSCSIAKRKESGPGRTFIMECQPVSPQDAAEYLYIHPNRDWFPVNEDEAARFLQGEPVVVDGLRFKRQSAPR